MAGSVALSLKINEVLDNIADVLDSVDARQGVSGGINSSRDFNCFQRLITSYITFGMPKQLATFLVGKKGAIDRSDSSLGIYGHSALLASTFCVKGPRFIQLINVCGN
jgi:hypothetical protein